MDLRHLETFLKVAELKSFTKAAEELYLTQPTISKQIVDLERYFGIRLIDRTKRSVTLTKAGDILLGYARDFVYLKKEVVDAISDFKGLKKGSVHVGASTIPGIYILPEVLNIFKKQFGGVQIKLTISDSKDIIGKMVNGEIDIGFVGAKEEAKGLEYRRLLDDTILFVAPSGYPDSIKISELRNYPLVAREAGSGTRNNVEGSLRKLHIDTEKDLRIVAELTDTEAIKAAVKYGMGISYISRMAVNAELAAGSLKVLNVLGVKGFKRSFYSITKKGKTLLPQVKALIEIIDLWKKQKAKEEPVLAG
jgi:DNA-binding transcriptional LysR family regulator